MTSSGIAAGRDGNAAISPWAAEILERYGFQSFAAANWQKTTEALIQENDVIVFMESEHQQFCDAWVDPGRHRIEVWDIEDIGPMDAGKIPDKVERTFAMIRERTDALLRTLANGAR